MLKTSRVENALELHAQGMNCTQSVVCNYCDLFGIDKKTAYMMAEGFGAGIGSMENICGALSGMVMLLGLKSSSGTIENPTKADTYKLTKEAVNKFKEQNGATICKDLKGINTGKVLRSCNDCIKDACKIFEEYINK